MSAAPARDGSALLRIADLHVSFGGHPIVSGVSLELARGEVLGLIGPNGAGKTTLLRAAAGVVPVERGEIWIDGVPLNSLSRRALAQRVAVVPQDTSAAFPFLAGELVLMGRTPHQPLFGFESRADVELALEVMRWLGIEELVDRPIASLSGGERQLVVFARALVQEPDLLLLDEPTAFLDLRHRVEVLGRVRALADEGHGALVVTHDIGLAARVCDRVALLADGRLVAQGPPRDVIEPAALERTFGIRAEVIEAPDGSPLVIPAISARPRLRRERDTGAC